MRKKPVQHELLFRTHGGRREGAGRKPRGKKAGVSHAERPLLDSRHPVLVTIKVCGEIWSLRTKRIFNRIWHALRLASSRRGFRIVHFSVQNNHVHLIIEAKDKSALSRGMQGLSVRIARAINRVMERTGKVFADRYHERVLRSPKQTRHALNYVLSNAKRHGIGTKARSWVDGMSSAPWFEGWKSPVRFDEDCWPSKSPPTAKPNTWLLSEGWRRGGGLLDPARRPGPS